MLGALRLRADHAGGADFFDLAISRSLPASVFGAAFAAVGLWFTDERFVPASPLTRQPR